MELIERIMREGISTLSDRLEQYRQVTTTGKLRAEDLLQILGDPSKSVDIGRPTVPLSGDECRET